MASSPFPGCVRCGVHSASNVTYELVVQVQSLFAQRFDCLGLRA